MLPFTETLTRLSIPGFQTRNLSPLDFDVILGLVKACPEYFIMESGHPGTESDVRSILFDLPPGRSAEDKTVLGLFSRDRLTAVIDLMKDYPEAGIAWIGLILIHPDFRGLGLGRKIVQALCAGFSSAGVKDIRLGVLQENQSALNFWKKLGFEEIERKPDRQFGEKVHTVIVFKRKFTPNTG